MTKSQLVGHTPETTHVRIRNEEMYPDYMMHLSVNHNTLE